MTHFSRRGLEVRVRFDEREADILRDLVGQMQLVLADDRPGDPALRRLFPDAYEDRQDAAAFRELVGDELRTGKVAALEVVANTLGETGAVQAEVTPDDAEAWLRALTDLRLTLGERLGVTEEMMEKDIDPNSPDAPALSTLHWLGWLQEMLLEQMAVEGNGT